MPHTEYNKQKAYRETYELLLLTYRKTKNVGNGAKVRSLDELKCLLLDVLSKIYKVELALDKDQCISLAQEDIEEVKFRYSLLHIAKKIDDEMYADATNRTYAISQELDAMIDMIMRNKQDIQNSGDRI